MDLEAERRALEQGYQSDMEREAAAYEAAAHDALPPEEREAMLRKQREEEMLASVLQVCVWGGGDGCSGVPGAEMGCYGRESGKEG